MVPKHHPPEPEDWAEALGVSTEATALLIDADFLDLHQTTEVPVRLLGYDPTKRHPPRTWPQPWVGHCDFPRLKEGAYSGVFYDITTNPFRTARSSLEVTTGNVERALDRLQAARAEAHPEEHHRVVQRHHVQVLQQFGEQQQQIPL